MNPVSAPFRSGCWAEARHKAPSPPTLWIWTATTRPIPWPTTETTPFTLVDIPEKEEVSSASWGIWSPWWQENWVWVENWEKCWHTDRWTDSEGKSHTDRWYHWVDNGWWEDQGWWEFDYNAYTASLTATMVITPDSLSPTASSSALKSGYGIQQSVTASVSTTQSSAVTAAQNAVTYFPEFNYEGFWRLLDRSISGKRSTFTFKDNPYSTYNRPDPFHTDMVSRWKLYAVHLAAGLLDTGGNAVAKPHGLRPDFRRSLGGLAYRPHKLTTYNGGNLCVNSTISA